MPSSFLFRASALALTLAACATARAHITYSGRDFFTFSGGEAPRTVTSANIRGLYSWASGTDENYGWSELVRAYRFTLTYNASVSIDIAATTNNGAVLGDLFPAFSLYSGLAHTVAPFDHDEAPVSIAWRGPGFDAPTGGNFRALGDWKVGNDDGQSAADLSSFTYIGHAADGTSANYGNAPGINGDGTADGHVVATFHNLAPGDYTFFVGGALLSAQTADSRLDRGAIVTLSVVPEPASAGLLLSGIAGLLLRRRRR